MNLKVLDTDLPDGKLQRRAELDGVQLAVVVEDPNEQDATISWPAVSTPYSAPIEHWLLGVLPNYDAAPDEANLQLEWIYDGQVKDKKIEAPYKLNAVEDAFTLTHGDNYQSELEYLLLNTRNLLLEMAVANGLTSWMSATMSQFDGYAFPSLFQRYHQFQEFRDSESDVGQSMFGKDSRLPILNKQFLR